MGSTQCVLLPDMILTTVSLSSGPAFLPPKEKPRDLQPTFGSPFWRSRFDLAQFLCFLPCFGWQQQLRRMGWRRGSNDATTARAWHAVCGPTLREILCWLVGNGGGEVIRGGFNYFTMLKPRLVSVYLGTELKDAFGSAGPE